MKKLTGREHLKELAMTLMALTLLRNDYKPSTGDAAVKVSGAEIYVSKEEPENNGEEFAVHSFWLESKSDIPAVLRRLKDETFSPQMPHYVAFVTDNGTTLVVSPELESKMIYDEDALHVETLSV